MKRNNVAMAMAVRVQLLPNSFSSSLALALSSSRCGLDSHEINSPHRHAHFYLTLC
jgi:hypothetical protein